MVPVPSHAQSGIWVQQKSHSLGLHLPFYGECKVLIYNTQGKQIYNKQVNAQNGMKNLKTDLSAGLHFMKVVSNNKLLFQNTIVVN